MSRLSIKPRQACTYDLLSLGEIMLRLDPGSERIRTARTFRAWEGGGEYNVARGLRRCFGMKTAIVTALADNDIGRLLEDLILQGGVDPSLITWRRFDGIGREVRNGLNFTERGFGVRGALGVSDRGHTAAAQLKSGDIDWERIFGQLGVRWFHTGGIFAGLSENTAAVIEEAMQCAKAHGTVVSYDLNYRPSLWQCIGGREKAQAVNLRIAKYVDVMLGNEEDFTACLGFAVEGQDEHISSIDVEKFKAMIEAAVEAFPNFKAIATTLRTVKTASINDWGAIGWYDHAFYSAVQRNNLEILDRVGGGDSFASGLIYGFLETGDAQMAVNYGAAHGALAMTTPGDTSMATLAEVEKLMAGASARVIR